MSRARLGVDVGGTFTDLVALIDGDVVTAKVPSTPDDQSAAVMACIEAAAIEPEQVDAFAHGMTVATNALLERRGARTAVLTTAGFRDVLEIGRQDRPALYDLARDRPPPLVRRELRFGIPERMGPAGEIAPLDEEALAEAIESIRDSDVESVAVCLLFAFLHDEHERRVERALAAALPRLHVSRSSAVLPEFREFERFSTTVADAYLAPRLAGYLGELGDAAGRAGLPSPLVMQSSGGVVGIDQAARQSAACLLSGPAGGVVGAAYAAAASGYRDVLTFDMGGTSTDVAAIEGGEVLTTTETVVAGVPIRLPMVDVHTVSAGGGSIGWVDAGGALRAGPHSAGAEPGPAAYGRGGREPTVTDANLLLGYLEDGRELGGQITLSRDAAERALRDAGDRSGLSAEEAANGLVHVANAEMAGALRVISIERGLDPREFALVAFGGAGPMHACSLADELGIETVLIPRASGVLSALGLAISDLRHDDVRPFLGTAADASHDELDARFEEMEVAAGEGLEGARFRRRADLRYRGQSFELTIDAEPLDGLEQRFHSAHERRYGYRTGHEPVELVNLRVVATVEVDKPALREPPPAGAEEGARRKAAFDGEWVDVPVLSRERLGTGSTVAGPAIVEFAESTLVVRPAWSGRVDDSGTLVLSGRSA